MKWMGYKNKIKKQRDFMSIYISGIVVVVAAASSCYCLIQCKKQFFSDFELLRIFNFFCQFIITLFAIAIKV